MVDLYCNVFTVSKALSYGIWVVSNGSVWDGDHGACGWVVLSTDIGEGVAKGLGPACCGAVPDSFRAEAYGMLATTPS